MTPVLILEVSNWWLSVYFQFLSRRKLRGRGDKASTEKAHSKRGQPASAVKLLLDFTGLHIHTCFTVESRSSRISVC